jgi:hypothetical protein
MDSLGAGPGARGLVEPASFTVRWRGEGCGKIISVFHGGAQPKIQKTISKRLKKSAGGFQDSFSKKIEKIVKTIYIE